ncbi:hypothetical protein EV174_005060 [Coemansia sp. RSA 2320]|nr:hypothetical protein EV174_005060 [Coemansia sp. RSA 2320]
MLHQPRLMQPLTLVSAWDRYSTAHAIYVPNYVNISSVQSCLEDRRSQAISTSPTFDANIIFEKKHMRFLLFDKEHFEFHSRWYEPVKFSYKSRNAVMSWMWKTQSHLKWNNTKFKEVDGLWQLEQLPVLYFVFGHDADTLKSSYLVDDNTISELYETDQAIDVTELAVIARSKPDCVSHFFVVNRGQEYRAVSTVEPSVSYTFGPSTKTRVISQLANGSKTIHALIDEGQPLFDDGPRTNKSPGFKLRDCNGEEVVEGERFMLQIVPRRSLKLDPDFDAPRSIFDCKEWIDVVGGSSAIGNTLRGSIDYAAYFGLTVVDGLTHLTFEGRFLQVGDQDSGYGISHESSLPPEDSRIQISYGDNGDIMINDWLTNAPMNCDWVKASVGYITIEREVNEWENKGPGNLRVIKV